MHFSGYDFFQSANSLEITGGDETGCIGPSQFNRQQIDWFIAEFGTSVAKKLKIVCKIVLLQNIPELFCERRLPLSNGYNLIIEYEREEQVTIKGWSPDSVDEILNMLLSSKNTVFENHA